MAALLRTTCRHFAHPLRTWQWNPAFSGRVTLHFKHALTTSLPSTLVRSFRSTPTFSVSVFDLLNFWGTKRIFKSVEEALKRPVGVQILASKPHHAYQEKVEEIENIQDKFNQLKKDHGAGCVVGVYIKGSPASGKTQLAREFGERYYKKLINSRKFGGSSLDTAVVATIDARTPASFLRSYLRLAQDLGLPLSKYNMPGGIRDRVIVISIDVQKALAETAPNWLLIIDGIDPGCKFYKLHVNDSILASVYVVRCCTEDRH